MRAGNLVGIITEADLFRVFLELFAARRKACASPWSSRQSRRACQGHHGHRQPGGIHLCQWAFLSKTRPGPAWSLKVRNVDRKMLLDALSLIEDIAIVDVRENVVAHSILSRNSLGSLNRPFEVLQFREYVV